MDITDCDTPRENNACRLLSAPLFSRLFSRLRGRDDRLVKVAPLLAMIGDWRGFLDSAMREEELGCVAS